MNALGFGLFLCRAAVGSAQPSTKTMPQTEALQWEYKTVLADKEVNELAAAGRELVTMTSDQQQNAPAGERRRSWISCRTTKSGQGESSTGLFGGNSNWRGPIWFPVNYLLIESLQKFHHYLGDDFNVECPTGSGNYLRLWEVVSELSRRLTPILLHGPDGSRPVHGPTGVFQNDPNWRDLVLFYDYFHGDDGSGVGASHQTGWTGLAPRLLQQSGE